MKTYIVNIEMQLTDPYHDTATNLDYIQGAVADAVGYHFGLEANILDVTSKEKE